MELLKLVGVAVVARHTCNKLMSPSAVNAAPGAAPGRAKDGNQLHGLVLMAGWLTNQHSMQTVTSQHLGWMHVQYVRIRGCSSRGGFPWLIYVSHYNQHPRSQLAPCPQ